MNLANHGMERTRVSRRDHHEMLKSVAAGSGRSFWPFGTMSYHVNSRWGASDDNPSVDKMREALAELEVEDVEHPDVALIHQSGWCLGAYPSGLLVWENLEAGEPRHMRGISRERVLELWQRLSRGELDAIEVEPWKAGYG